jgi:4-amino-4-deoxy-L-arabinose transferase-like glycosyltransferase
MCWSKLCRLRNVQSTDSDVKRAILCLAVLALIIRMWARLYIGGVGYFNSGYSFFFSLAQNIAAGKGIGFGNEPETFRVPLYAIALAAITLGREAFLAVALVQSLIGAATIWFTGCLARMIFGNSAAIIAAIVAALYPYYLIHDTALGETSLFTLLTIISVLLLLRAQKTASALCAISAGLALGLDLMTRATIAPFVLLGPLVIAWLGNGTPWHRIRNAALCVLASGVVAMPWVVRSYRLTGHAVLSTQTGFELWNGNNENTFTHYPRQSIDRSAEAAFAALTPEEKTTLGSLDTMGAEQWYRHKAAAFFRQHPFQTVYRGFRKLGATFGLFMSPRHGFLGDMAHALSYGPVMVLGLLGMWMRRRQWREDAIIYALFLCFILVTIVFFGHTSHRSYLDVYWMVFAAGAVETLRKRNFGSSAEFVGKNP